MPSGNARSALYVEAVRRWEEHVCEPVPCSQKREHAPKSERPTLASIMADVATLVALGRRATMPDSIADYDAAYHALEAKIARALPKSFTERLEETR